MIIVSMLLSVSLNVGTIIVNSAKMSGNLGDGVRAFHAADSGIEHALYHATRATSDCNDFDWTINADYAYTVDISGDCPASPTEIISVGEYKEKNQRTLEVNY